MSLLTGYARLVVVGGPGSGKSTAARAISRRLGLPHVELDSLWWQPGWQPSASDEFVARVMEVMSRPTWIMDGNYFDEIAELVWPAADAVLWLDLDRRTAVRRALVRAVVRVVGRRPLWNGNRESWQNLSPTSIARLVRNWPRYPATVERLLAKLAIDDVIRIRTRSELRRWLSDLS